MSSTFESTGNQAKPKLMLRVRIRYIFILFALQLWHLCKHLGLWKEKP